MKQPDFGNSFHLDAPRKIKYMVRFDANLLHDMTYLASYIHDSRFKIESVKHIRKRLIIPLERDCWELYDEKEVKITNSKLTFFPVERFSLIVLDTNLENGIINGNDDEGNIWISRIYLSDDYYDNNEDFNIVINSRGFKLRINMKGPSPLVKLEDLTTPASWKE